MVILGLSYNQPIFCPDASWDPLGTTLVSSSSVGSGYPSAFVDLNDTIYVASPGLRQAQVWYAGSPTANRTLSTSSNAPYAVFAAINGDIFVDDSTSVDRWTRNSTTPITAMVVNGSCWSLFVDIRDQLYCAQSDQYRVIRQSLWGDINQAEIVAGNGTLGSAANTLNGPRGISVDLNITLYVADCFNNRVQMFRAGEKNGTTIAGQGATGTIILSRPVGIVMDGSGYLFIVDVFNSRIVGSGPNGFRCIVGCGAGSSALNHPRTVHFDSQGNLVVMDSGNRRIQIFLLTTNSCGKRNHSY